MQPVNPEDIDRNPRQKKNATPFIHRYEMTKILIEKSNKFEISDVEKSEDVPSYTVDTLTKLNHKKDNLYFILGSDTDKGPLSPWYSFLPRS